MPRWNGHFNTYVKHDEPAIVQLFAEAKAPASVIHSSQPVGHSAGHKILYYIYQAVLRVLIAAVVIAFALPLLLGFTRRFKREGMASVSFGFVSGVLSSSTSLGGPPVVLF